MVPAVQSSFVEVAAILSSERKWNDASPHLLMKFHDLIWKRRRDIEIQDCARDGRSGFLESSVYIEF